VLALYGIKSLQISGKMAAAARTQVMEAFKNSDKDGPRVLVVSGVGLEGLNIPWANVGIMVVRTSTLLRCSIVIDF
jgi:superfamily II DNA or RNA helicase